MTYVSKLKLKFCPISNPTNIENVLGTYIILYQLRYLLFDNILFKQTTVELYRVSKKIHNIYVPRYLQI